MAPLGESADACKQRGNELLKKGDEQGALAAYLHGLELAHRGPLRSQLHSNCAHVYLRQPGQEEQALDHCKQAIADDGLNIKAQWRAATAALRLARWQEAEGHCRRGLELDAGNRELLALLEKVKSAPSQASAPPKPAERLRQAIASGRRLLEAGDIDEALKTVQAALDIDTGEKVDRSIKSFKWELWEVKAHCHFLRNEWWDLIKASESAASYGQEQDFDSMVRESRAFRELGLLYTAEEKIQRALEGHRPRAAPRAVGAATEHLQEVAAARRALEDGDNTAVQAELQRLQAALSSTEAETWVNTVRAGLGTSQGRTELSDQGFLQSEWLRLPPKECEARTLQRVLLCQVKKRLQQELSLAPVPEGGVALTTKYTFANPASLRHPSASTLLGALQLQELRKQGLTVIDQAFDSASMSRLRAECEWLDKVMGMLSKDDEDTCNPLQRKFDVPLGSPEIVEACRAETPTLFRVLECLRGLPALLEDSLGLQLRVPETAMISCYPSGAFYRRHLDSYGGRDIPRKVTILLYCNSEWRPGDGGSLRAWLGEKSVEFEPLAGRVIIFMSQDIWHEVTESKCERYALTQWVWDVKRDSLGR